MTVTAWEVLDLAETDDVRSIKRAYAKALKRARPDDDPAGFQQLTSAFEWALGYADHCARQRAIDASPGSDGTDPPAAGEQTRAAPADAPDTARASDGSPGTFDFGPFFEQMGEQIRKGNPLHLKEWLESHPDLYSIELKWALIPYVFDALARNAAALDPHRGHLTTLQGFFGVDATLRAHSAIAPAIDFLESKAWKQPPPDGRMPAGWENVGEVMDRRRPLPHRNDGADIPLWAILLGILAIFRFVTLFM